MFYCNNCRSYFDVPFIIKESQGAPPPYCEESEVCPSCQSSDYKATYSGYCRCCGRKIPNTREYCNETCRKAGEEMWVRQRQRQEDRKKDPMYITLAQIDLYNKKHGTNLSYGQYTAMKGAKRNDC